MPGTPRKPRLHQPQPLVWRDPPGPPRGRPKGSSTTYTDWVNVGIVAATRRGSWLMVGAFKSRSAGAVGAGAMGMEHTTRANDAGLFEVYVRWPATDAQDEAS